MYIMKDDFHYLERLYRSLDEATKKKFMEALFKDAKKRAGEEVSKINVVDDSIFDSKGIEQHEIITRTMIKKAYMEAKGGYSNYCRS